MKTVHAVECEVIDLGLIGYDEAYALQKEYVGRIIGGEPQKLLICEHPPVITKGRMTDEANLLFSEEDISRRGVKLCSIDRGGDITLHAPGQLVAYPLLNLENFEKDLHKYIHALEDVGIDLLNQFDILTQRNNLNTGLWVDMKKIMSIGIGVRKWVTFHGIGLNVNTDLSLFSLIKPCGLDVNMTSMEQIKGRKLKMPSVKSRLIDCFEKRFHLKLIRTKK